MCIEQHITNVARICSNHFDVLYGILGNQSGFYGDCARFGRAEVSNQELVAFPRRCWKQTGVECVRVRPILDVDSIDLNDDCSTRQVHVVGRRRCVRFGKCDHNFSGRRGRQNSQLRTVTRRDSGLR